MSSLGDGWHGSGVFIKQEHSGGLDRLLEDDEDEDDRHLSVKRPRRQQVDTSSNPDVEDRDQPIPSRERDSPEEETEVAPSVASPHPKKLQTQRHASQSTGS